MPSEWTVCINGVNKRELWLGRNGVIETVSVLGKMLMTNLVSLWYKM